MWKWNDHEIVLLIEAVKRINSGAARGTTLKKLSKKLRRMALNRGENIGKNYRNYRAMNSKAHTIEYLLYGIPDRFYSPRPDFIRIVCSVGTPEYSSLLKEAEELCSGKDGNGVCGERFG